MAIVSWPEDAPRGAVSVFCRRHGISRSQFYAIRALGVSVGSVEAVLAPRRRMRPDLVTPAAVEAAALRIRKELAEDGWDHGPLSVRHQMMQAGLPAPSRATLARIFVRYGAVVAQPQKRPHTSWRRFTFPRVHDCWQLDATEWRLRDGRTVVVFQLLDDHSRFIVGSWVATGETSAGAVAVMSAAVAAHQAPVLLLSDNGVALNPHRRGMTSDLVIYTRTVGTRAITSRVYHPQTCGKNERVHSTLKKWLRARPLPETMDELSSWITIFDERYNYRRPHQALQMRTPAEAFTHDARALPPLPPEPADLGAPPRQRTRRTPNGAPDPNDKMRLLRVAGSGQVKAANCCIQLGTQHAGSQVMAMVELPVITIFDVHGTELRTIHITPGKIYYGNGARKGGPRHPRLNATISDDDPTNPTVRSK
jgi:putative transposase